jgi:DNA-binding CsgD family transcriptional regulator
MKPVARVQHERGCLGACASEACCGRSYDCSVLVGRGSEQERVSQLLVRARKGQGGTLVIRGEAGIGKTAMLRFATSTATGLTVLSATGIEAEVTLPYGGLADLVRPVTDEIDRLPPRQAATLEAVLGRRVETELEQGAVAAAAFALLNSQAARAPLVVVLDDLPWLDAASRDAALFLARRSDLGGFAVLLAARDGDVATLNLRGLSELRLAGLSALDSAALIESQVRIKPTVDVARQLAAQTSGNPLALGEVARMLSAEQLTGSSPLDQPLPTGEEVERIFSRLLDGLEDDVQTAILVAAATDCPELAVLREALSSLGTAADTFDRAERAGVLQIDAGEVRFRHPLLRTVAFGRADGVKRRAVHSALAGAERDTERRARHLAAAATGPDEAIAAALEAAAAAARSRGALAAAAGSLRLAARMSETDQARAPRLLAAASAAQMAGQWQAAVELADQLIVASDDPTLQADAALVRARAARPAARPDREARLLVEYGERVVAIDPARAIQLWAEAVGAWFANLEFERALELAERSRAVAARSDSARVPMQMTVGMALSNMGRAGEAAPLLRAATDAVESSDEPRARELPLGGSAATALMHLEEYERARRLLGRMADYARRAGALSPLVVILALTTTVEASSGEWPAAAIAADETARLASDLDLPVMIVWGRVMRAEIAAVQGDDVELDAQLSLAAELADAAGLRRVLDYYAALARGKDLFVRGEYELAASTLQLLEELDTTRGTGSLERWLADVAETLVRCERADEARAVLERFESIHRDSGQKWAQAAAARLHGLLEDEFDEPFARALELGETAGNPFETARTALCYGERLRRRGARRDARAQLSKSLATFVRVGARPWAQRAQAELRASGQTRAAHGALDTPLTPSERQVAALVAEGLSNQEIGMRLFISVRTVEMHISHAYRKLGIRSRAGLARHVLIGADAPAPR